MSGYSHSDVEDLRYRLFTHVSRLAALSIWLGVPFHADLVEAVGAHIDKARAAAGRSATKSIAPLHRAAWELSTYAASVRWDPKARNTQDWLDGLRERIEAVQAFGCPDGAAPGMRLIASRPTKEGTGAQLDREVTPDGR